MTKNSLLIFITVIAMLFMFSGLLVFLGGSEFPKRLDLLLVLIGGVLGFFGSVVALFYQRADKS